MSNSKVEPIKIDKTLRPETRAQRGVQARIGEADIAECRARVAALGAPGRILDAEGNEVVVPPMVVRAFFYPEGES